MRVAAAVIAIVCVLGSCGNDGGAEGDSPERAEAVVRAWADTLRRGDVRGAAEFFVVPSVVSNGTQPVTLRRESEVRRFNASLPCGARLVRASTEGVVTTATFRLTERPGRGRCGDGTGATARTSFVIRDGKIHEWHRVADEPEPDRPIA
jgi:hypothetical protein